MAWPLLLAGAAGAVLVYEKAGDLINEWRGVGLQPVVPAQPSSGSAPGAEAVLLLGAGLVAAWWLWGRR